MPAPATFFVSDLSRYRGSNVYQDPASGQAYFGPWKSVAFPPNLDDAWVQVRSADGLRLDRIASEVYNTPELWWVLAAANEVHNPFTQLFGYAAYARSPLIFAADARPCFYLTARQTGATYNVDAPRGLTFAVTATALDVYVAGVKKESFVNLSPYPVSPDGTSNYYFWGTQSSAWVKVNWVSPDVLQPSLSGIEAPVPVATSSYLTGGVDEAVLYLRVPSRATVAAALEAAATG